MPTEIDELVIRASVQPEGEAPGGTEPATAPAGIPARDGSLCLLRDDERTRAIGNDA